MTVTSHVHFATSPARSCSSAPARWAARCWKAGSRSGSIPQKIAVLRAAARRRDRGARGARRAASIRRVGRRTRASSSSRSSRRIAAEVVPTLKPLTARRHASRSRSWPGKTLGFLQGALGDRAHRARDAEHAGRDRARHHGRGAEREGVAGAARARRHAARRVGAVEWVERRSADRCRHRRVRLGPGLCVPARRKPRARRRRGGPAGRPCGAARARDGVGLGRTAASLAARCRDVAAERDLAGRNHGGGARRADGATMASIR